MFSEKGPSRWRPRATAVAAMLRWSLAVTCVLPLLIGAGPVMAQESGLAPGGTATVANTNGDGVVLREGPGYDARVLEAYPEGTAVDLSDGPIGAEDGSVWYGVTVEGRAGYIVSDFLSPAGAASAPTSEPIGAPPAGVLPAPDDTVQAGQTGDAATSASPGTTTIDVNGPSVAAADAGAIAPPLAAPAPATTSADQTQTVPGEAARANDLVNLRAGPGDGFEVLRVLPPGAAVTIIGPSEGGWTPVSYNGSDGFIVDGYLDRVAADEGVADLAQETVPEPPDGRAGMATVIEAAELKADPLMSAATLATVPVGVTFAPTGGPVQGFYQVTYEGQAGWVSGAFLAFDAGATPDTLPADAATAASPGPDAAPAPAQAFGGLVWPVAGGLWYVLQGYNGSSHVNRDSNWQYAYALDVAREDGETAGIPVVAPASGTVRWTDPNSGGLSIDLGDGFAVAMFHITLDGTVRDGDAISQGDPIGTISGPGGMGYSGTPHLHIALWETSDGGNWDRHAQPFVGAHAIASDEFPDIGGGNQYRGLEFTP